jgi:hypothetical protein
MTGCYFRLWHLADMTTIFGDVRFSNRPFGVKHFQTTTAQVSMSLAGSRFSSESAPGPFHYGVRRRGGTIFQSALPSERTAGSSGHTNSPHPSSREGQHSTARWSSSFLLSSLIL